MNIRVQSATTTGELVSLTSLRFFAALVVVLHHLSWLRHSTSWSWFHFSQGYLGVTFFFILSGFILSHAYGRKLHERKVARSDFWIARIARIYPLHVLTTLLAIPVALLVGLNYKYVAVVTLSHLSLTHAFVPGIAFELNGASWSLSTEAFFYLLFPWLIVTRTRWLILIAGLILIYHIALPATASLFAFYILPPARLGDFVLGIVLYRWFERHQGASPRQATAAQIASLLVLFAAYLSSASVPSVFKHDFYYVLPMGLVIVACGWQQGAIARALSSRSLVLLGEASFALYLIHGLVIFAGDSMRPPGAFWELAFAAGCVVVAVFLSIFLYRRFEVPARVATISILRRLWSRHGLAQGELPTRP